MFLILGPALNLAGSFFWKGDGPDTTGATLVAVGLACWLIGLIPLYQGLPSRWGRTMLPLTVFGVTGGLAFSVQAIYEVVFDVSHARAVELLNAYPIPANVLYWICGPLFPLAMALLGVALLRLRAAPVPVGLLLVLGAVAFPLSRITRELVLIHAADLLLLLPFLYLGVKALRAGPVREPVPAVRD
ncbi:hypothetical protein AB0M02_18950 [Actinoplanes sp. NPDC051861]|uniref:hypothetical protein n=1 Tax=Actinoplanes sp. NPDC051861 TaxID=3155170 RepID=UPI00344AB9FD